MAVRADRSHGPKAIPTWPLSLRFSFAKHFDGVTVLSQFPKTLFGGDVWFEVCFCGHFIFRIVKGYDLVDQCIFDSNGILLRAILIGAV